MSKHTPVPWRVEQGEFGCDLYGNDDAGYEGSVYLGDRNMPADSPDARLIIAAPCLLSIAQRWAALDGGAWHAERYTRERDELLADTRAAIAKATQE